MTPLNDLERLLSNPKFGPESYPEMFRLLRESELVFLLPYHPEMEGAIGLKNGDALPPFVVWENKQEKRGARIPIFSSIERAQEACKKTGARDNQYALAEMKGKELFHLISCQEHSIVLNPATSGRALFLDMEGVKQVAAAPYLEKNTGPQKQGKVQFLTAADYPTNLVQALFQRFRQTPGVQAAWMTKELNRTEPGTAYIVVVIATCDHEKLRQDILIVAGSAIHKDETCFVSFIDSTNAQGMAVTAKFTPFFAAPDFKAPSPLGEG